MALHTRDGGLVMPDTWTASRRWCRPMPASRRSRHRQRRSLPRSAGPTGVAKSPRGEHLEHARLFGQLTGPPVNGMTLLLALGRPDPEKQYTNPMARFDADQLFTLV
ncbi:hypothetical protein AB0M87_30975 [Streptomyces sp. NPDC051320]|uniref:hypothetical protein n=1 Tax=Streptomyces sp. NPDC051320 TaxID=3154644 RepID=UPI0034466182